MKKAAIFLTAALALFMLAGCGPDAVVLYTDLKQADAEKLVAPFVAQTGVQVRVVSLTTTDTLMEAVISSSGVNRSAGATAAPTANGYPPADVVLTGNMLLGPQLARQGALLSYMPAAGEKLQRGASGGGYWYGFGGRGWVLAWNTDLVKKPPDSYMDLDSAAFPMRSVALPNPQQYFYYPIAAYDTFGRDYVLAMFQTLLLNEVQFISPASAMDGLERGNYHVAVTTYALAKAAKDRGSPVDFAFPDQGGNEMGAFVEFYSAALAKGGRNLKQARKLEDWLLSPEAEKLSVELGLSDVTQRDVGAGVPVVKPLNSSPDDVLAAADQASRDYNRLGNR